MTDNNKPTVFVSYSHKDEPWKDRLHPHLGMLKRVGHIDVWDDRRIGSGEEWYDEIKAAMEQAAVAVCLISADYLDSDFCSKEEIPYLLERRERDGMKLIPVLVRPCLWQAIPWLSPIQMIPRDGKSVAEDFAGKEDSVFTQVAGRVHEIVTDPTYQPPAPPPPKWTPPDKIDIDRLPVTGSELFGRRTELAWLDEAWETENINVVSLVAWGGVGKTTLVNKWLEQMAADNYRGARRVYVVLLQPGHRRAGDLRRPIYGRGPGLVWRPRPQRGFPLGQRPAAGRVGAPAQNPAAAGRFGAAARGL